MDRAEQAFGLHIALGGGEFEQAARRRQVLWFALTEQEHHAAVAQRGREALLRSARKPERRVGWIRFDTPPRAPQQAQVVLRRGMALFGGKAIPPGGARGIRGLPMALVEHEAKHVLGFCIPTCRGRFPSRRGARVVAGFERVPPPAFGGGAGSAKQYTYEQDSPADDRVHARSIGSRGGSR